MTKEFLENTFAVMVWSLVLFLTVLKLYSQCA